MGQLTYAPRASTHPDITVSHLDRLPVELISRALSFACDGTASHDLEKDYKFPSVLAMVSKRFYFITLHTPALWRYFWLSKENATHEHVITRIKLSGTVSLIGHISIDDFQQEHTPRIIAIVSMISSRLSDLTFFSCMRADPILSILQFSMPRLSHLAIHGLMAEINPVTLHYEMPPSRFPVLKTLLSENVFNWQNGLQLPRTIEELDMSSCWEYDIQPAGAFWDFLPPNLRRLRLAYLPTHGTEPPIRGKHSLNELVELDIDPCSEPPELAFLQHLSAPRLKKLAISIMGSAEDMGIINWPMEFPALKRFELKLDGLSLPRLDLFLGHCADLRRVYLLTEEYTEEIPQFVDALAGDPHLLPNLVHLTAPGVSVLSLRIVVKARPRLRSLEVHIQDLGLTALATMEEFVEWEECVDWLGEETDLDWRADGSPSLYSLRSEFHWRGLDRYYTWEDMKRGIPIDTRDWRSIEDHDDDFWYEYRAQRRAEARSRREARGGSN